MKIKKAVLPVAGLGTRMLPATKAIPKEMLPIVDKPLIQYVVNEAVAAGIKEIVLVTHSSKNSIENHFDTSFELEATLGSDALMLLYGSGSAFDHPDFEEEVTSTIDGIDIDWEYPISNTTSETHMSALLTAVGAEFRHHRALEVQRFQ